ncbi:hypothetical protein RJ640_021826 [Escallonia rubra]|uniref:AMP-dependent synthetase/ligase domain-containing protein n=1 Tax=Escallonia rubra TaxID=112253 RepID=A0AA88RCF8_9ASTE|nr:hypothetical protein RJ640_021826 [Escallonia rubra]
MGEDLVPDVSKSGLVMVESGIQDSTPLLVLIADHDTPSSLAVPFSFIYEGVVEKSDPRFNWVRPETEWDPMVLNYTSGTTSSPKGVIHSHRGVFIITVDSLLGPILGLIGRLQL